MPNPPRRGAAALSILILLALALPPLAAATEKGSPLGARPWQLPKSAEIVVLELSRTPVLLAAATDRTQTVRVLADGRLEIHQPAYLRAAGDYRGRLDPAELDTLLAALEGEGLFAITQEELLADRSAAAARQPGGRLFEVHDGMRTAITVRLESYTAADGQHTAGLERTLRAANLEIESRHLPSAGRLVAMARAEALLLALTDRTDLERQGRPGQGESP